MVEGGNTRASEALRINGLTPNSTSCIAFYIEASASQELNLGRDIVICARNFQFGYNLAGEEEGEANGSLGGVSRFLGSHVISISFNRA